MKLENNFRFGAFVTLEKIKMLKGKKSSVLVGTQETGRLFQTEHGGIIVFCKGGYAFCDTWIQTSKVKKILESTDEYVVFETQTSVYKVSYHHAPRKAA